MKQNKHCFGAADVERKTTTTTKAEEFAKEAWKQQNSPVDIGDGVTFKIFERLFQAALDAPVRFTDKKPTENGKYIFRHSLRGILEIVWVDMENDFISGKEGDGVLSEAIGKFSPRLELEGE